MPGGHSGVAPPDPIPNSEVKRSSADDSVGLPHVKVGHRQALIPKPRASLKCGVFLWNGSAPKRHICYGHFGLPRLLHCYTSCCVPAVVPLVTLIYTAWRLHSRALRPLNCFPPYAALVRAYTLHRVCIGCDYHWMTGSSCTVM